MKYLTSHATTLIFIATAMSSPLPRIASASPEHAGESHSQAEAAVDWCLEHGLPESACTLCNPELEPRFRAVGDWCAEHAFPESVCPFCNPQPAPAGAVGDAAIEKRIVRLATDELEGIAGLRTVVARHADGAESVECPVRLAFDANRIAETRSVVPGIVRKVSVTLGATVAAGDPLFELESTRISEVQANLQAARERIRTAEANLQRQRGLRESAIASARQVEVARQELAAARSAAREAESVLALAGADASEPTGIAVLRAPIAGTVIRRPAIVGTLATPETLLATIADTATMWALCSVSESEAPRIALGQPARVSIGGGDDSVWSGEVSWIDAEVDPRSRTVAARIEIANPDGRLRANQFARARIETGSPQHAVAVPRAALQRVDGRDVVFVRTADGVYTPRVVRRIASGGGDVAFVNGEIRPGEEVVTTGAILLRTELLPGSIGAGCCEVAPPGEH